LMIALKVMSAREMGLDALLNNGRRELAPE
jgi:hypothetical protein